MHTWMVVETRPSSSRPPLPVTHKNPRPAALTSSPAGRRSAVQARPERVKNHARTQNWCMSSPWMQCSMMFPGSEQQHITTFCLSKEIFELRGANTSSSHQVLGTFQHCIHISSCQARTCHSSAYLIDNKFKRIIQSLPHNLSPNLQQFVQYVTILWLQALTWRRMLMLN